MQVFLSVQFRQDPAQAGFISALQAHLSAASLTPVKLFPHHSRDPLPHLREMIGACQGALIVAFARFHHEAGVEFVEGDWKQHVAPRRSATVWNQVEAAMAYQAGIPVLILQEYQLTQEGLIDRSIAGISTVDFRLEETRDGLPLSVSDALAEWSSALTAL